MDDDKAARPVQLESVIKRAKVHTTQSYKPKTADTLDKFERKSFRSNGMLGRESDGRKQSGKYRMACNVAQERSPWKSNVASNSRITSERNSPK